VEASDLDYCFDFSLYLCIYVSTFTGLQERTGHTPVIDEVHDNLTPCTVSYQDDILRFG